MKVSLVRAAGLLSLVFASSIAVAAPLLDLPSTAASQPALDSPSAELPALKFGQGTLPESALNRGMMDYRLHAGTTVIGGYGEFTSSFVRNPQNHWDGSATLRRLVVFLAHNFNEKFRTYLEIEWENARVCASDCLGEVEIEQAFVDWQIGGDAFGLRAGLVLMPFGIINQWHEPPIFHGVERPAVDRLIIPTTWRELGLGVFGAPLGGMLHYEAYVTTTYDPAKLSENGLRETSTEGSFTPSNGIAAIAHVDVEPRLGLIAGASAFASETGDNLHGFDASGAAASIHYPTLGYELDLRLRQWGVEARVVWADFFMPNASQVMRLFGASGGPIISEGTVPKRFYGGYIEGAYDILRLLASTRQQLLPFVRLELYDSQAQLPGGFTRNRALTAREITTGLSYRPIQQLVFKADAQFSFRDNGARGIQLDLGTGFMF